MTLVDFLAEGFVLLGEPTLGYAKHVLSVFCPSTFFNLVE